MVYLDSMIPIKSNYVIIHLFPLMIKPLSPFSTSGKSKFLAISAPSGYINGDKKKPTPLPKVPPSSPGPYDAHQVELCHSLSVSIDEISIVILESLKNLKKYLKNSWFWGFFCPNSPHIGSTYPPTPSKVDKYCPLSAHVHKVRFWLFLFISIIQMYNIDESSNLFYKPVGVHRKNLWEKKSFSTLTY